MSQKFWRTEKTELTRERGDSGNRPYKPIRYGRNPSQDTIIVPGCREVRKKIATVGMGTEIFLEYGKWRG